MFTGIIESLGEIVSLDAEKENLHLKIKSSFGHELRVDQSLAHNGVCLTVVNIENDLSTVTAIKETLDKTNLGKLNVGDLVNLERCMPANGRFDGHIVQGHVDQVGYCKLIEEQAGSWKYTFEYDSSIGNLTVEKGSICINGVSLTVVDSKEGEFTVAIIPYTYHHTNFKNFKIGSPVNLEFDILGKYITRILGSRM